MRRAVGDDQACIREMLYQAVYVAEGQSPGEQSIVDEPELAVYHEGWMRKGDEGVIAEVSGRSVGAAWVRLFSKEAPGYGFVSEDIGELTIALLPEYRGCGIGTMMLKRLLDLLARQGVHTLSLSVDPLNPALRLYKRFGFIETGTIGDSLVMTRKERSP